MKGELGEGCRGRPQNSDAALKGPGLGAMAVGP